jgi:hypothetical protein
MRLLIGSEPKQLQNMNIAYNAFNGFPAPQTTLSAEGFKLIGPPLGSVPAEKAISRSPAN